MILRGGNNQVLSLDTPIPDILKIHTPLNTLLREQEGSVMIVFRSFPQSLPTCGRVPAFMIAFVVIALH